MFRAPVTRASLQLVFPLIKPRRRDGGEKTTVKKTPRLQAFTRGSFFDSEEKQQRFTSVCAPKNDRTSSTRLQRDLAGAMPGLLKDYCIRESERGGLHASPKGYSTHLQFKVRLLSAVVCPSTHWNSFILTFRSLYTSRAPIYRSPSASSQGPVWGRFAAKCMVGLGSLACLGITRRSLWFKLAGSIVASSTPVDKFFSDATLCKRSPRDRLSQIVKLRAASHGTLDRCPAVNGANFQCQRESTWKVSERDETASTEPR